MALWKSEVPQGDVTGLCAGSGNRSGDSRETSREWARFAIFAIRGRRNRGSAQNRFVAFIEFRRSDAHPFGSARRAGVSKEIRKRPLAALGWVLGVRMKSSEAEIG